MVKVNRFTASPFTIEVFVAIQLVVAAVVDVRPLNSRQEAAKVECLGRSCGRDEQQEEE